MKKIVIILICLFLTSCTSSSKFSIEKEYYQESKFINVKNEDIEKLKEEKKSFIVFAYNNYCLLETPCDEIFKKVMDKYNISFLYLPYEEMKKTFIYDDVKLTPSVILIKEGKIVTYLNTESNDDLPKYQDADEFEKWLTSYINT